MAINKNFILIDDERICNMLSEINIKKMFDVNTISTFTDPEEGLRFINDTYSKNPVETVMFIDINMPLLSGWDVIDKLSRYPKEVLNQLSIYVVSSSIDPEDKKMADDNEFIKGYLLKPITAPLLQQVLT